VPIFLLAQCGGSDAPSALDQNRSLVEQFAQLAPMGINPYVTVFLTSICSKLGFANDFVGTNPFFNNWFVVILFGILFSFTALVGTIFKTNKATAPIGLVDDYLSNHAAVIINAFVMLAPTIFSESPMLNEVIFQAGFLSVTFQTVMILGVSTYFLIIVMTVRFFTDILIFLSPVPLIDSILEIIKIVLTAGFVFISIISPLTSVVISGLMFVTALLFYRRSKRLVNKTKYLVVHPIFNFFRTTETTLANGHSLSIPVYVNNTSQKIKAGTVAKLKKRSDKFFLINKRLLRLNIEEEIALENYYLTQTHLSTRISTESENQSFLLNRSYHKHIDELAEILDVEIRQRSELERGLNKGIFHRIKSMFNKIDMAELKAAKK
jgi:hypothetical protein